MNETPKLETDRLILEPMHIRHVTRQYLGWLNDPEVCKYLETPFPYKMQELKSYVENMTNKNVFFWAVILKYKNTHIGNIKIELNNSKLGEFGILFGEKTHWGKGYAQESSRKVFSFCFDSLQLRKINLGVVKDNYAAIKLYSNLGFETEGTYRMHGKYDGRYCDVLRMSLFNENDPEVRIYLGI